MKLFRTAGTALRKLTVPGLLALIAGMLLPALCSASELDLQLPTLDPAQRQLLYYGLGVCVFGMAFGLMMFNQVRNMPAHKSMLDVSHTIYETCKAYLLKQGQLLMVLEVFIGACIIYYFGFIQHLDAMRVVTIILFSILGILGSYGVAWFGIRMNTFANSRAAFASLKGKPLPVCEIPLQAGMSIGVLLICVELLMMLAILLWVPAEMAGACFLGFAIGESLGASALRIAGGIFTKIADIGSDLMKVVFKIKEDDPRNPGVIADCTGDNAGDSVGPTADGFETYGVTGVALISFIALAVMPEHKAQFLVWIFVMRVLMILTSILSYVGNAAVARSMFQGKDKMDFEAPLTSLVWVCSALSIAITFVASKFLLPESQFGNLWFTLSMIISCGTLAAAVIPEFTKVFTSSHSRHVAEVVAASKEGGASLNILSGMVAGNFSVFWKALTLAVLLFAAYYFSGQGLSAYMSYPAVFAFGLVAFGLLGMGPVTIAVDSYGPVTDNAQSIFELSQVESTPGVAEEIEKQFHFKPDFEKGKHFLEDNDGAGNTFKATAKPVLIATAVAGATTMLFSIVLTLQKHFGLDAVGAQVFKLDLLDPYVILGLLMGGGTVYWFTGASMQAVTTGAYRAVEYIKKNIKLDSAEAANIETSRTVVRICTEYAQAGMFNIFIVIFCLTIAYAFFNEVFFIAYLVSIAVVGLFQAVYMANAGGAWDNAKKVVEVELNAKGTELHAATVVGDTVGDPYKDTSSVALNPIIKFTTLFGLLAVEMAVANPGIRMPVSIVFMLVALVFVYRSFYNMRIASN
ncbi:MAG: sodium-translocating pyrophosphatase [Candidatus Eisenbacteria bacterium]|uniref:K(+)-insensitive pyrophosphate-energized proton pump n=1 Tax=Eiseniibacteriota bacterium TaxID=2212470 RepID=A0A933SBI4_UNCEI|nr:sodium-translocating pyrophosphatase [Candidatus Eisenbacteria bacterium]